MFVKRLHEAIASLSFLRTDKEDIDGYGEKLVVHIKEAEKLLLRAKSENFEVRWVEKPFMRYTYVALNLLKALAVATDVDSPSNLISIPQQRNIKTMLQMIMSFGMLPYMKPGVEEILQSVSKKLNLCVTEARTFLQDHQVMTYTLRQLLLLIKYPNLRSLILLHLRDIIGGLLQLMHYGNIKKPAKNPTPATSPNDFVMTEQFYNCLIQERKEFKEAYNELTEGLYKPLVIKELLILIAINRKNGKQTPVWLQNAVTRQLDEYLLRPGGVALTMRACCSPCTEPIDMKKVAVISKLISVVRGNMDMDHYYSIISPQIIALFNTTGPYCVPVAKQSIRRILETDQERCTKYIFNKLLEPFIMCSKPVCDTFSGTLISEESMGRCIEHIASCFEDGSCETALPLDPLLTILKIMLHLYMKVRNSVYQHKEVLEDLFLRCLGYKGVDEDLEGITQIYKCLLFDEKHPDILEMNPELSFEFGPSGGVQVVKIVVKETTLLPDVDSDDEFLNSNFYNAFFVLISENKKYNKNLLFDLFFVLVTILTGSLNEEPPPIEVHDSCLDIGDQFLKYMTEKKKKLNTMRLLGEITKISHLRKRIKEAPDLVLDFLVTYMQKQAADAKTQKLSNEDFVNEQFVTLHLLELLTSDIKPSSFMWTTLKPAIEPLKVLMEHYPILKPRIEPLIHRITIRAPVDSQSTSSSPKSPPSDKNDDHSMSLDSIIRLMNSDEIPIKGHGLIKLRDKIEKCPKEVLPRKSEIFVMLKELLRHPDTYVYLAAIYAFDAMGRFDCDEVADILCEEYTTEKADYCLEQLKLGEVLVRLSSKANHIGAKSMNRLINTFLVGVKSADELYRTSCLSNLGEVLRNFKYSVGPILFEVVECVKSVVSTDESLLARRAAMLVLILLITGHSDKITEILGPALMDINRFLKLVSATDASEEIRELALDALEKINVAVRSELVSAQLLEKKIGILSLNK